jgi:DNA repair ATPase RecN
MADDREVKELNAEQKKQVENNRIRRILSNAYAALLGSQTTKSFSAFTFEEAMDAHVDRIEGDSTPIRPNLLERVDNIENQVLRTLEEIKATPPEYFEKRDNTPDLYTNTPEDPDEEELPTGEDTDV